MKTLIATLLATAAGASFAAAPTAALNHDPATYRNLTQKAESEYRAAAAKCDAKSGNDKDICMAEARLVRTRTEADALSKYNNTAAGRARARTNLADAEYDLAKAKCDAKSGADKDSCMDNAKSVHTAALADAKAERTATTSSNTSSGASSGGSQASGGGLVTSTDTRDPAKAAAVDKCAQMGADAKTGCLVETKPSAVRENAADAASKTRDTAATAADKVKAAAATVAEKTKDVAHAAVEKTKEAGSTVAQKTDNAMDRAGDQTADKTRDAAGKTRIAASDTAITTKVKAGLVKEPNLDSLGIHVETEKGVVMLSGFVNSKEEADKAVKVAKGVEGVSSVKSAIKVK
ncbi:BON domain-containing protein [Massilia sp. PDC64]|nr:BON domain-containing protein [Massilia sp. PDC64]SDC27856.1 BON domain-containing protein [Massilia sp. PDC64]